MRLKNLEGRRKEKRRSGSDGRTRFNGGRPNNVVGGWTVTGKVKIEGY